MPQLNNTQKAIIQARLNDRVSIRRIANELEISKTTVLRAKRKIERYAVIGRNPGSGRPKISTALQDNALVNFLRRNPFETAVRAARVTEFPGSITTIQRRIRNSDLRNRCAANKTWLTDANKQERMHFALEYATRQDDFWNNVIFSDEKTFQSTHNGILKVYRPRRTRYDPRYTRKTNTSGRFKVNVWCWISARGPGMCVIFQETLNAIVYRRILDQYLLPSVRPIFGENFIFQDDNCPIHRANIVQEYLRQQRVVTLPWCSKSPDLNPVENIWGKMVRSIRQNNFRPTNVGELQRHISEAWQQISPEFTMRLISSMPKRLLNVIEFHGEMTKY